MQNELLHVMALRILREIAKNVCDRPYCIMALGILREIAENVCDRPYCIMVDETTDASTQERVLPFSAGLMIT